MEQKLYDAASRLPETSLDFHTIQPKAKPRGKALRVTVSLAACLVLLVSIAFVTVEAKEYGDAVAFFKEYGLSTEGLSRGEIKAVYRDITTASFTYTKTAEVIASSLSTAQIGGYEILQANPSPEEIENLWNYINYNGMLLFPDSESSQYKYRSEYRMDEQLGFAVHDKSFIEKYDAETLLWSVPIFEFRITGFSAVSDGVIAYGQTPTWSSTQRSYGWIAKIDSDGSLLWKRMLNNGFGQESIAAVLENADGSYGVISRGDLKYFCLSQYAPDGEVSFSRTTEVGNYGIWNAARLGDGYIVQLGSYTANEHARIVKVDREGSITESFSYGSADAYYYITDMIAYNGNIYLSAYAVPKLEDEAQSAGGRYEIAAVLNYLFDNDILEISSEALTPMVRDNYTAMLLVCDPKTGIPREFYSAEGSLGGSLGLSDSGMLLWDVESISSTFLSLATSSFTIGGSCCLFRYTFDSAGNLVSQENTGQLVPYRR